MTLSPRPALYSAFASIFLLQACSAAPTAVSADLTADQCARLADAAEAGGESNLAFSMYAKAIAAEPNNPDLRLRYATALAQKGRMEDAHRVIADQYARTPDRPDVIRALALLQLLSGSPREAIAGFDRLLAKDPENAAAALDKAVALDLIARHSDAQAIYRGLLVRSPDDAAVKNDLAMSLTLERRTREALDLLLPLASSEVPARIRTNIAVLMAANGEAQNSRDLLADEGGSAQILALASALRAGGGNVTSSIVERIP